MQGESGGDLAERQGVYERKVWQYSFDINKKD